MVGAVVLPALAVLALMLVPFIDRGQVVRVTQRTFAMAVVALAADRLDRADGGRRRHHAEADVGAQIDFSAPTDWMQLSPEEMAGIGYFRKENCDSCHTVGDGKPKVGPDLADDAIHKTAAWMIQHFKRPAAMVPGSAMPPIQLSDAQLNTLAAFLLKLNQSNAEALLAAPEFAVEGALVYQAKQCGSCHTVNGVGMKLGPPLNGLESAGRGSGS